MLEKLEKRLRPFKLLDANSPNKMLSVTHQKCAFIFIGNILLILKSRLILFSFLQCNKQPASKAEKRGAINNIIINTNKTKQKRI